MRPPIFRGKVEEQRIVLDNRNRFREYLLSFEGKRVELVLRERQVTRSDQQNRYYHGVVIKILSDHLGYEPEEMHETLKKHFNVDSTSKLKTKEFKDYVDRVVRWAASELIVSIPPPTEVDF